MLRKYIFGKPFLILGVLLILMFSCGGGDDSPTIDPPPIEQEKVIPSNLSLSINVVGADQNNPYGDGSGVIQCKATATDAVKYGFRFGTGTEIESTTGDAEHTYNLKGEKTYTVYAYAYSVTGDNIYVSETVTVLVSNQYNKLAWSDEFDVDGSPDGDKWTFDLDNGSNGGGGWGNGEKQYYTDRPDNVIVSDGNLIITAKREDYNGAKYTSARLKTQDRYDFTYGRVEVRAKLPEGDGTWPAIWMLGSNISSVGWPECGEIDIMEHWGYEPGKVSSATHNNACHGGCNDVGVGSTIISDYSTAFHVYAMEWDEEELSFYIDGEFKYRYKPSSKNNDNWPYTRAQFIILNIAMGGSWFDIDPNFEQSTMEIDYVRVYQKED